MPDFSQIAEAADGIEVRQADSGFEVVSKGMLSREAESVILSCVAEKQRDEIRRTVALHRSAVAARMPKSPASQGMTFAVPLLLVELDGELEIPEPELLAGVCIGGQGK